MKKPRKISDKRLITTLIFTLILFFMLMGRLFYLQIYRGEELKSGALRQWTKGTTIKPRRGLIYDRNGKKLAVNKNASTVWVDINELKKDSIKEDAAKVSLVLDLDEEAVLKMFNKGKGHEKLKQWVSEEEIQDLEEMKIKGIEIVDDYKRYYPNNSLASHVLGFTDIDNNGLYGIEKTYDDILMGKPGKMIKTTDVLADTDKVYEAEDGMSLVLTIDETIQKFAEKAVDKAVLEHEPKNISVIALEPNTGDVLAMVNRPNYNPNLPREPIDENIRNKWKDLSDEELQKEWYDLWRNFSINDVYEPGSTFKVITAAAALEENAVTPESWFYCNGYIRDIKGVVLKCARYYDPHRDLNLKKGLDVSCNVVFVNTARKLGKEQFLRYVQAFGFGEKTGIDLNGEEYGLIPESLSELSDVRLATMSYGQGVAATPIQMVNAVATVANGGNLMKPRLVKEILDSNGKTVEKIEPEIRRKVISKETSDAMLELMESVVENGGGKNAYIPGYSVGGKTGTSSKYVEGKYVGSFVAVSPTKDPKMVLLVIIDDPKGVYYGGTTAAPVAKEIIENTLNYLEVTPREFEEKGKDGFVVVPDLLGMKIGEAGELLSSLGLRYMTRYDEVSSNSKVISQKPNPGTTLELNSVIDLNLSDAIETKDNKVPNLIGLEEKEIKAILDNLGIEYNIEGKGVCVDQTPKANEEFTEEKKIEIKLE